MEAEWIADRATLRWLVRHHPDWTQAELASAVGRSRSWVVKWVPRLNTTRVLLNLPDAEISDAQLSPDGQWIVFIAYFPSGAPIRLIRLDGQDQQTLYCADSVSASGYDESGCASMVT